MASGAKTIIAESALATPSSLPSEAGHTGRTWAAPSASSLARQAVRLALVAATYWVAARLSLNLALVHGQVTPIWPPTGIALVAILLIGRRVWPAIALAAFAVNLPIGPSPLGAAAIAAGNTLAPLAAAELLRRVGFRPQLDRLRDAMALILLGALAGMSISATVGTSVLVLSGSLPSTSFWSTWAVWWTGDAMGVLLVAPFLLSLRPPPSILTLTARQGMELAGLLAATAVLTYLLFQNRLRLEYLVLPLIMAAAWRFRLRGAAPAALLASGIAIWSAVKGTGPFATESLFEKMVTLQVFNVMVALASFLLASFVDSQDRQEEMTRLYASAKLASESKSAFLNVAAHELRGPLSVLTGYLSMLADGSLGAVPDGWRKALAIITGKADELNKLVGDLLDAGRLEIGAWRRPNAQVDLRKVIREAVDRARPRADLLGAEIATGTGLDPVLVAGDAGQLGRVLDNLINNGLSYSVRPPQLLINSVNVGEPGIRTRCRQWRGHRARPARAGLRTLPSRRQPRPGQGAWRRVGAVHQPRGGSGPRGHAGNRKQPGRHRDRLRARSAPRCVS